MASQVSVQAPGDYHHRIRDAREIMGLTQSEFAERVGVSFATVNRWENRRSRPNRLAWARIVELKDRFDQQQTVRSQPAIGGGKRRFRSLDFSADPEAVAAVAEAHRLTYGHQFNSAFATETSLIDPLPHQILAVYHQMMDRSPLRFLLADDAGAGKTIMTGLYIREMLSRRLIRRVLIVPPAGLVGNWERELRTLFQLRFRIVSGSDARMGNPFSGPDSDLVIVSVDTAAGGRTFARLRDPATAPYDLVVFDEAHKLSADRKPDFRVRKTARYRVAEAIAGADVDDERWQLPWSAHHLLLLTATPHMGKDYPYYYLWRLLLPDTLSTYDAFNRFPAELRRRHYVRRTKEEMVGFDEMPLYPQRKCDTLSYALTDGERELYDETTSYIQVHYNRAQLLNRSAARLAMGVFQRRLASSTYALMRSFERRIEKLQRMIDDIRSGRLTEEKLARQQRRLDRTDDMFETQTVDEYVDDDIVDQQEEFEDRVLAGTVAVSLAELEVERRKVEELLSKAQLLLEQGAESKFNRLQEVLRHPDYADQKLIIFTEHRDTALFLIRRLEGLGFTGQVASIHGGLPYQERERQVDFFKERVDGEGARYLVATDAAGEGINLQFCWLMVNYDIPWNPARLEQRMGRIHRYGQSHDPVVIVNLVADGTREGRVMKTLLDKLETIRRELGSDKVFDVIGRLFERISMKDYLDRAATGDDTEAVRLLEGSLTRDQVVALRDREAALYGVGGEVRRALPRLRHQAELDDYWRLIPGYVRRFVERTTPLLEVQIDGDLETVFTLTPTHAGALDPLLTALETYPEKVRERFTVNRPRDRSGAIWVHPGEPVFDSLASSVADRFGGDALRGSIFIDPSADEPYLFHTALVCVERSFGQVDTEKPAEPGETASHGRPVNARLVGLRQQSDGQVEQWPVEHLLLLKGAVDVAPGQVPLAATARGLLQQADDFVRHDLAQQLVQEQRLRILKDLPERVEFIRRGFDFQGAELAAWRLSLRDRARAGDGYASSELAKVRTKQRRLAAARTQRLAGLAAEPDRLRAGDVEFLVHALVLPSQDADEVERFDVAIEDIAMSVAMAYEESRGAVVTDVSKSELAFRAGLPAWPGFDLQSWHPVWGRRSIEVKGRARSGSIEISDNEWSAACNLRSDYWLYVVFDCGTPNRRLIRIRDPFGKLIENSRQSNSYIVNAADLIRAAE